LPNVGFAFLFHLKQEATMQRRILLSALLAAIMLAILISAAAMAKKTAQTATIAGIQQCTRPGSYVYDPITDHSFLTDTLLTCTLTALDGDNSLMPMGTGIAVVHMNADFTGWFKGFMWGEYTITTTAGIVWQGTFNGTNNPDCTWETGNPIPTSPSCDRTVLVGHASGMGRYSGYSMSQAITSRDNASDLNDGVFVMEITIPQKTK
jgi:hypothetical protein